MNLGHRQTHLGLEPPYSLDSKERGSLSPRELEENPNPGVRVIQSQETVAPLPIRCLTHYTQLSLLGSSTLLKAETSMSRWGI